MSDELDDFDERNVMLTEKGLAILNEAKDLWFHGVTIEEIESYLKIRPGMLMVMLAMQNLLEYKETR